MIREIRIFFTALMFYTRIPCPKWVDHDPAFINLSIRYFPLIGWIVGGISFLSYFLFSQVFGDLTAIIFSLIASVLTTGAFHEDGFADVCDGFGGGWTKEKILEIMKDSRVGTYGVVGLLLLFGLKVNFLFELVSNSKNDLIFIALIMLSAHSLSRLTAATFIFSHEYVREDASSKVKPVAKNTPIQNLLVAASFGLAPLVLLGFHSNNFLYLLVIPGVYLVKVFLGRYFNKWIGGYTGDCLGATQQVAEVFIYAAFMIIWKFI